MHAVANGDTYNNIPQLPEQNTTLKSQDINITDIKAIEKVDIKNSDLQTQDSFTNNEINYLLQNDDDIVEGELTRLAYIDYMNYDEYITVFKRRYISEDEIQKAVKIDQYLKNYDRYNTINKIPIMQKDFLNML